MLSTLNSTKILFLLALTILATAIKILSQGQIILIEWEILQTNSFSVTLPIILDINGLIFRATVFFISANVMWFATSYMAEEINLPRFTTLVNLFITSINLLIFIPNIACLLIGWDGLGLVSFLLVIYYQNHKSCAAGMITALTNRIGDVILLVSISWAFSIDSWSIFYLNSHNTNPLIWLTIIVAAITKRAQTPFSAWLPAAIAAPTPVSALVHSSTLVTAGVFLLFRFHPLLSTSQLYFKRLILIASITILIAGMIAIAEIDIKKIIALRTLRQLGVIIFSLSANIPDLAFLHLITHALFKACLFICAGNLIHIHHHSQDLRLIGNSNPQSPVTARCITVANLALCALPFIAGFYSKDVIIESSFARGINILVFSIILLATFLTAAYSIRLTKFVFLSPIPNFSRSIVSDREKFMIKPMINLSIGAVSAGAALTWALMPWNKIPILPPSIKIIPLVLVLAAAITATVPNRTTSDDLPSRSLATNFLCSIWFLNFLSTQLIIKPPQLFSFNTTKVSDQRWNELMGPQGLYHSLSRTSSVYQPFQANPANFHLLISFFSCLFLSTLIICSYNLLKI